MNWKIRLKNPVFWVQILTGALATVLAYSGLTAESVTTWAGLWNVVSGAFSNPYCLFLVASNIWNALNDPTTAGVGDSKNALGYTAPAGKE